MTTKKILVNVKDCYLTDNFTVKDFIDQDDTYYGMFYKSLITNDFNKYANHILNSPETWDSFIYRAKIIKTMQEYDVDYKSARELMDSLVIFNNIEITESIELNILNYINMRDSNFEWNCIGSILKNGRINIIEGVHRLIINHSLNKNLTQMIIMNRDDTWSEFVEFINNENRELYGDPNLLYMHIDHPDFRSMGVIRDDRSEPIIRKLRENSLIYGIDIGCQLGYNTLTLARQGFKMTALEHEQKYFDTVNLLSNYYNINVNLHLIDLYNFDYSSIPSDSFVILTSVLYHLIRNNEPRASDFLNNLKLKFNYFFIDTENRTGILTEEKLLKLMDGFNSELIFSGTDDRNLFFFKKK